MGILASSPVRNGGVVGIILFRLELVRCPSKSSTLIPHDPPNGLKTITGYIHDV